MRLLSLLVLLVVTSASTAQWLPDAEQHRYRAIWDATGVEFPEGAKFYKLKRVSQRLVTVNEVVATGIYDANYTEDGTPNINRQNPWVTPAGLHYSPGHRWDKVGLALFPGEIEVWRAYTPVFNGSNDQPQLRILWQFPKGTVFAEMLLRRHEGNDIAFEIRERRREEKEWTAGVTYRPWVTASELPKGSVKKRWMVPPGKLSDFGETAFEVKGWELPRTKIAPMKLYKSKLMTTATHDEAIIPKDYLGNVTNCAVCHDRAAKPTSYASLNIPGSDSVIGWHPFSMQTLNTDRHPKFDMRWPLKMFKP